MRAVTNNGYKIDTNSIELCSENIKKNSFSLYIYLFLKRTFDIICSIIGLIMLIPIIIVVKIVYILNKDYNKIIYTQERIGKNGKLFKIYKLRSMVVNADEVLEKILKENKELKKEYKINKKLKDDPRITKIGKILRKTSLDELPQFINVFKSEMSMIGNRPYLPKEKEDMGKYYQDIIKTKPGLTGLWQVSGRSNVTFENRTKLESIYSNNCGILLDLKIFIKTFITVFKCSGAK